eukprot:COSAG06_NODE_895_length_11669_cov_5.131384_2_plen_92_part_00
MLPGHEGNATEGSDSQGAPNLVTGAGAFLQSVVHGYGGVRWEHPAVLTLRKPRPLPGSTYLRLRKLSFMGVETPFLRQFFKWNSIIRLWAQ